MSADVCGILPYTIGERVCLQLDRRAGVLLWPELSRDRGESGVYDPDWGKAAW